MRWLLAFLLVLTVLPVAADEAAAWAVLRAGGHVALMRHADAPGVGDPPGYSLDDCTSQRLLDDTGRARASAVGDRLREEGAAIGLVLSSPWCRCIETAERLGLGPVSVEEAFSNAFVLRDRRDDLAAAGGAVIRGWRGPGTLLVVTHGDNIAALTGARVASGEIVVVAPDAEPGAIIGRIPPPDA